MKGRNQWRSGGRTTFTAPTFFHQLHLDEDRTPTHKADCYRLDHLDAKPYRCLPSFSIAGFPKAGTSALHWYLGHHPKIIQAPKELCPIGKTSEQYFKSLPPVHDVCSDCVVGETCINLHWFAREDLYWSRLAYKMVVPTLRKVLFLVRNPLDLAYAAYWFWCTPEEKARPELDLIPGVEHCDWNPQKNITFVKEGQLRWYDFPRSAADFHRRNLHENLALAYHDDMLLALRGLLSMFGKKGVHVIPSERLLKETEVVLDEIRSFLDVPYFDFSNASRYAVNVNHNPGADSAILKAPGKAYPPLLKETREMSAERSKALCLEMERLSGDTSICRFWQL
jgi:hypothetical protein